MMYVIRFLMKCKELKNKIINYFSSIEMNSFKSLIFIIILSVLVVLLSIALIYTKINNTITEKEVRDKVKLEQITEFQGYIREYIDSTNRRIDSIQVAEKFLLETYIPKEEEKVTVLEKKRHEKINSIRRASDDSIVRFLRDRYARKSLSNSRISPR